MALAYKECYSKWSAPTSSPVAMHTKPSARRQACSVTAIASCGDLASHTARHFSKTVSKFSSISSVSVAQRRNINALRCRWRHPFNITSAADKKVISAHKIRETVQNLLKFWTPDHVASILHHTTLNTAPHNCGPYCEFVVRSLRFFFFSLPPRKTHKWEAEHGWVLLKVIWSTGSLNIPLIVTCTRSVDLNLVLCVYVVY